MLIILYSLLEKKNLSYDLKWLKKGEKKVKENPFSIAFNSFTIKFRISWHFTLQQEQLKRSSNSKRRKQHISSLLRKTKLFVTLKSPVVNQAISILLSIIYNQWFVWQRNELCSNHLSNILVINNAPSEVVFVFSVGEQMGVFDNQKNSRENFHWNSCNEFSSRILKSCNDESFRCLLGKYLNSKRA